MRPSEVKALRRRLDFTQRELAHALGVTSTTVARWEQGARAVSPLAATSLMLLLRHLGPVYRPPRRRKAS